MGEREKLMSEIPCSGDRHKYEERPPACGPCGADCCWDGFRKVRGGTVERRRARCTAPECPVRSFTVYEDGGYPHRGFSLDTVASAVAAVAIGDKSQEHAGAVHGASRRSVGRWLGWVQKLADPQELMRLCTRLGSDGLPGGVHVEHPAGQVLHLLDRLADLLSDWGAPVRRQGSGLGRILGYLLRRFRHACWLTKSSPGLHDDLQSLVT